MAKESKALVKASYRAPNGTKQFEQDMETSRVDDVASKQIYLATLRSSTKQLQEEVNVFLTKKMEEDKALASSAPIHRSKDEEEEENYGEEKIEDY